MGVSIREDSHPNPRLTHFTVNVDSHTISTTVTSHPGVVRNWIYETLYLHSHHRHNNRLIIGLGVQWTPSYSSYHQNPAATLQLCVGKRCLIFQLRYSSTSPTILRRILSDPNITFVGLHNHSDSTKLAESHHRLEMADGMPVDLRVHVSDSDGRSLASASIEEIAEEVLGLDDIGWSRGVSMSDWDVEELSFAQVKQATIDAFVGFCIGVQINAYRFNDNLQDMMDTSSSQSQYDSDDSSSYY